MGKIMMNGIQYGVGGIEQAKDISYDNTESGATATDVQGALDELNNGLSMTRVSQPTTVNTTINFRKIGRLVIASHVGVFSVSATGTKYTISEIPTEFTPIGDEYFSCVLVNNNNVAGNARLCFERNTRRVHLVSSLTGSQEYCFTVAYFSAS